MVALLKFDTSFCMIYLLVSKRSLELRVISGIPTISYSKSTESSEKKNVLLIVTEARKCCVA